MTQFSNYAQTAPTNPFESTSVAQMSIGEKQKTSDGREFVYVKNGATATVAGSVYQAPAVVANHQNLVTALNAAGSKTYVCTLGATAATVNQYAGGYVIVNAGTGIGQTMKIASHAAVLSTGVITLILEDALPVATAVADSKTCLIPAPTSGVVVSDATTRTIGVANTVIPANYYGFLQTKGYASVLNSGGTTVALGVAPAAGGAVATVAATTPQIGVAAQAGVTAEARLVDLNIS